MIVEYHPYHNSPSNQLWIKVVVLNGLMLVQIDMNRFSHDIRNCITSNCTTQTDKRRNDWKFARDMSSFALHFIAIAYRITWATMNMYAQILFAIAISVKVWKHDAFYSIYTSTTTIWLQLLWYFVNRKLKKNPIIGRYLPHKNFPPAVM